MKTRSLIMAIVIGATVAACLAPQAAAQQKYAVLISTGQTTVDDNDYHSEYWYDLLLMYRTLIDRGFTHNNIFVLYGNGTDFASAHPEYQTATYYPALAQITDFATTEANINNIFAWLAAGNAGQGVPQIQPGDFLFFWWMGHGSWDGDDVNGNHLYHAAISTTGETYTDAEFAAAFAQLPACVVKTVFVMTCHSGALLDNIEGLHMAAHTSSRHDQSSYSSNYDVFHADFTYHASCALRQLTPAGAAVASDANTASSETVVSDYRGIAKRIVLANAQPAASVPTQFVFSRDHAQDDGTVPSNYEVWYEGPDLWVRWAQDGQTTHQNPEFGQTNYVYARVHNIGCATLNATAALSWSEVSAWASPASWNAIDTVPVNNLAAGQTQMISTDWDTVPLPGKYCLHTTLDSAGDAANADGRAYMDNNKVQINVTVEDSVWGWTKKYYWWIENGRKQNTTVDLVITRPAFTTLAGAARIQLALPAGLKFESVKGAEVRKAEDGAAILDLPARARTVVVQGISLAPLEKREATLAVILPKETKLGQSVAVRVSEQVRGQEMGGIVFRTRAAAQRQVLTDLVRQMGNFFRMLAKSAPSSEAEALAALCRKVRLSAARDSKAFAAFMGEVNQHEPGLRQQFGRLLSRSDLGVMNKALDDLIVASKSGDIGAFVGAQEAVMNASRPFFRARISR